MAKKHNWLVYALITMVTWGIWGAFSSTPDYPSTLTYVVWAISMIPCALVALANIKFKLDMRPKSVILSMGVGLLGAGGQLVLFEALKHGPAYLIFPLISVAPIVTVILSTIFLKERVSKLGILGIVLAFVALICFSLSSKSDEIAKDNLWILLASLVFICWGTQAFVMKLANNHTPDAESVFVYMAISAVLLIPVARPRLRQPLRQGDDHRAARRRLRPGDHHRHLADALRARSGHRPDPRHRLRHHLRADLQPRIMQLTAVFRDYLSNEKKAAEFPQPPSIIL